MSAHDNDLLMIYVFASPFLVFCVGLGVYWLTGWMDRREDRAERRKTHRAADWGAHTN